MKQIPTLLLVISGDQGCGDPGQLSEKSLDQDPNLSPPQPAGELNSAIHFWN